MHVNHFYFIAVCNMVYLYTAKHVYVHWKLAMNRPYFSDCRPYQMFLMLGGWGGGGTMYPRVYCPGRGGCHWKIGPR